jgi:hypothetical protein
VGLPLQAAIGVQATAYYKLNRKLPDQGTIGVKPMSFKSSSLLSISGHFSKPLLAKFVVNIPKFVSKFGILGVQVRKL